MVKNHNTTNDKILALLLSDKNKELTIRGISLKINVDYVFKCANSNAYSLLYMPYYVYHRGQKNKTPINRLMLNILFSIGNKFNYPIEEYILDAEIDEESRAESILKIRKNITIS